MIYKVLAWLAALVLGWFLSFIAMSLVWGSWADDGPRWRTALVWLVLWVLLGRYAVYRPLLRVRRAWRRWRRSRRAARV